MGIDKASAEYSRVELYARHGIETLVVLLYSNNLVATIGKLPNRYEGSRLKPLWSQQIV